LKQKYIPEIFTSPFCHLKYTLIRDLKECKHLGFKKKLISLNDGAAAANFIANDKGETLVVIYMPRCDADVLFQRALIVHGAVHIWQEIKTMMNKASPGIEFEAYSIQRISQDLIYLLNLSNDLE